MTVAERILQRLQEMPESLQSEVLDYVEQLASTSDSPHPETNDAEWTALSLTWAMRGMEDEDTLYEPADIKERFA